jgi:hypothetical protein
VGATASARGPFAALINWTLMMAHAVASYSPTELSFATKRLLPDNPSALGSFSPAEVKWFVIKLALIAAPVVVL